MNYLSIIIFGLVHVYKNRERNIRMKEWNQHRLLSRKEAAKFLGVKEITLAIWQSSQRYKLPIVKVGRLVKYRFEDLLEFIERRTVNQPTREGKKANDTSSDVR